MCTSCGAHHHGSCVGLALLPGVRAGWQCFECRVCQVCRQPSEIGKIMLCESCDKAYHPSCLRPIVTSIPKYGWKCKVKIKFLSFEIKNINVYLKFIILFPSYHFQIYCFSVVEFVAIVDLVLLDQAYHRVGTIIFLCVIHVISKEIKVFVVLFVAGPIELPLIGKWFSV